MALRAGRRLLNSNLHVIKSFEQYQELRNATKNILVGFHTAHFSAASKLYAAKFDEMAKAQPQFTFFKCDIDEAPRTAYDCEVEGTPAISVQPLGITPEGTWYDKTDLRVVKAGDDQRHDQIFNEAKTIIDNVKFGDSTNLPEPEWRFDPTTSTTTRV